MKKYRHHLLMLTAIALIVAVYIGCSDKSISYTPDNPVATVAKYFPLSAGRATEYIITNNWNQTTSRERFTVGTPIAIDGKDNYPWMSLNVAYPQFQDTGFFFYADSCLFFYDNQYGSTERVLQAPFTVGQTWQRSVQTRKADEGNNLLDILTGNFGNKNIDSTGGGGVQDGNGGNMGGASKTFPTAGADYFTVAAVENVTLADGNVYKNCLRIENRAGDYSNYYWYAPGVGLVRYVVNATAQTYPGGEIVGEIAAPRLY